MPLYSENNKQNIYRSEQVWSPVIVLRSLSDLGKAWTPLSPSYRLNSASTVLHQG